MLLTSSFQNTIKKDFGIGLQNLKDQLKLTTNYHEPYGKTIQTMIANMPEKTGKSLEESKEVLK